MPTSFMCKSTTYTCTRQEDMRAPACTRQETCASHLHASNRCVRHSLLRVLKGMSAHRRVHPRNARVPCSSRRKDAHVWAVTGNRNPVSQLPTLFATISPMIGD